MWAASVLAPSFFNRVKLGIAYGPPVAVPIKHLAQVRPPETIHADDDDIVHLGSGRQGQGDHCDEDEE